VNIRRRIFVSVRDDEKLLPRQRQIKEGVLQKIEQLDYQLEMFFESGRAAGISWSFSMRSSWRSHDGLSLLTNTR
jgi:hypothetical protein